jgi:SAM-dependent methyltransferase
MLDIYKSAINEAERLVLNGEDPYVALRQLPISVFGKVMTQPNIESPRLADFLPQIPPAEIQVRYNGRANLNLLPSSVSFLESVNNAFVAITGRRFPSDGKVLDYGFGWGRLVRMAYWLTSPSNVFGLDPLPSSIEICKKYGVQADLQLCGEVPSSLPLQENYFDLVFSFSVFTHLSFKAADAVLRTLHRYVRKDGLLVITIRPVEFWDHYLTANRISGQEHSLLQAAHHNEGFAYVPLRTWGSIDGEIHFGDTSMTFDFIKRSWPQWHIAGSNITLEDPYQLHVFLTPVW